MPILKSIGANKKVKNKVYTQTPASLKRVLDYVTRKWTDESEVYKSYGVGLSDNSDKAFRQMMFNKNTWDKTDGRQYKHYVTSYPVGFVDLETIEKITTKFVKENFLKRGFKCYVAIHKDKEHYHAHIVVDSVNFINGYKLQEITEKQLLKARYKDKKLEDWELRLEELKTSLEEISLEYGVPSPERNPDKAKTKNIGKMSKYKALEKANSWRNYIARVWEETILETTTTMENLEQKLKEKGIFFNRFNAENKTLTLATEYTVGEEKKPGKIRLNKLATEEDYRFQATPNIYQWDNFVKILEKHKEKEVEEELTEDDIEKALLTLEKDAELEKEFEREIEEVKLELDKVKEYNTLPMITMNCRDFYSKVITFFREFEEHKKDYKDLDELKNLKSDNGWELILEYNTARISQLAKAEKEEKERERERIEFEKMKKNFEYTERHDRIRAEEKANQEIKEVKKQLGTAMATFTKNLAIIEEIKEKIKIEDLKIVEENFYNTINLLKQDLNNVIIKDVTNQFKNEISDIINHKITDMKQVNKELENTVYRVNSNFKELERQQKELKQGVKEVQRIIKSDMVQVLLRNLNTYLFILFLGLFYLRLIQINKEFFDGLGLIIIIILGLMLILSIGDLIYNGFLYIFGFTDFEED